MDPITEKADGDDPRLAIVVALALGWVDEAFVRSTAAGTSAMSTQYRPATGGISRRAAIASNRALGSVFSVNPLKIASSQRESSDEKSPHRHECGINQMPKTAISFNVPPKLWEAFKKQTDELFLSRAPFLDHLVANELPHLKSELEGLKLSLRAKRHIAGAMKKQAPVSVNIEVRSETAEALREAVRAHNLVRDAFMTRLLIFLRSTDALLKYLEVPYIATSRGTDIYLDEMPASPLKAMEAVRDDPLFYVRHHVEHAWEQGIYRVALPRQLDWAACYLADEDIPGTGAHRRQEKLGKQLLAMLEGTPTESPAKIRRNKS